MPWKKTSLIWEAASDGKFNKLLLHEYSCSDFLASFLKGMLSCSACNNWLLRYIHG
jgi:hypothetical protein